MIRPYLPGDLWLVLPKLRQSELDELSAYGIDPETALREALSRSEAVTVELGGEVVGIAGMVDCGDKWIPWSALTEDICKNPISFLRYCKRWLNEYAGPMENVIDARNEQAKRWLVWLGFKLDEAKPTGENGHLFHRYWRR